MGNEIWSYNTGNEGQLTEFEQGLYSTWVAAEMHHHYSLKMTVLVLKLKNDFQISGTSGCEDPSKFDAKLGRLYALKDALKKLGEFATFHRAQGAYEREQFKTEWGRVSTSIQNPPPITVTPPYVAPPQGLSEMQRVEVEKIVYDAIIRAHSNPQHYINNR